MLTEITEEALNAEALALFPDLAGSTGAHVRRGVWKAGVRRGIELATKPNPIDAALIDKYPNQINKYVDNSF